jgi:uncharacterized membrane protein YraQ (UPF0718 family)
MSQSVLSVQEIQNFEAVLPPKGYCSVFHAPSLVITQEIVNATAIATSLSQVNTSNLAVKIADKIEHESEAKVDREKDGALAFTDNTNANQKIKISQHTRTLMAQSLQRSIEKYITQDSTSRQIMKNMKIMIPCGGLEINQKTVTRMIAEGPPGRRSRTARPHATGRCPHMAKTAVEVVMQSEDSREYRTKMDMEDKQKATDMFNSLFNNVRGALDGFSGALGLVGASGFIGVAIIAVAVIFFAPSIIGAVTGGGGGGGGGNRRRRRSDYDD